jgi:hypothetical protein
MSDFFRPIVLSARADNTLMAAWQRVLISAQQNLKWLPNLTGESASLFMDSKLPLLNAVPESLDPEQKRQWKAVWDAMQPIATKAMRGEMQAAAIDGQRLAANTAFWNGLYRTTEAVATVGLSEITPLVKEKWAEMQRKIKEWDETQAWALRIANHKDCPPDKAAEIRRKLEELEGSISGKITSLTAQIPGMRSALKQEGLGAWAALASLATIKSAVLITAIVAVVAIIVYCISSIKTIIEDMGLSALGDAVKAGQKMLGPWLGVAIFAGVGFILYKKFAAPKTVLRLR